MVIPKSTAGCGGLCTTVRPVPPLDRFDRHMGVVRLMRKAGCRPDEGRRLIAAYNPMYPVEQDYDTRIWLLARSLADDGDKCKIIADPDGTLAAIAGMHSGLQ